MLARRVLGRAAIFAALGLLAFSGPAAAQQPIPPDVIEAHIERGKKFLQKEQKPAGFWGNGTGVGPGKGWGVGYTALAGLTLIECGVSKDDPGIKRAANVVRAVAGDLEDTYELALAILFLDRMKDKNDTRNENKTDKRIIQLLAGRLMAAQMPSGGWGYKAKKYNEADVLQLVNGLRKLSDPTKDADLTKIRASLPVDMRRLAVIIDPGPGRLPQDAKDKGNDLLDATTDNSNTHFAMIGLWAARKYEIPVDRTFALVNRRFRTSQGQDGTWAYHFVRTGANGPSQHTCIALLGVAIGHVVAPEPGVKPEADPVILNAFVALSKSVGEPVGDTNNRPTVKAVGGLYFLWAMERIAVLYDIQKLGKKDWYQWGAEILIANQQADGSWLEGGFHGETPIVNTCLALMFLRRANLTPDLSKRLVVDTGVLSAKVDDKITPKVEPPPSPKVEEPPPTPKVEEPPPTPKVEPKKEPPPPPAPTPPPAQETPPAPAKKSPWLWIVLGVLLAGIAGGGFAFLVAKRMKKDDNEESEKKNKKGKKKAKVESESEGKSNNGAKKAKPKVEVEEDDE